MNKYQKRVEELEGEFLYAYSGKASVILAEEELQNIEATLGHILLPDYREFLRDFSGSSFYNVSFPLRRTSPQVPKGSLASFYGLKLGSTLDLLCRHKYDLSSRTFIVRRN